MADISKILTEAWLKVNEGIGSAANSIADATKEKVNEINLNSRRSEVLNQLVPKIVEIYRSGATLPEELTTILKELTDIEDQLDQRGSGANLIQLSTEQMAARRREMIAALA